MAEVILHVYDMTKSDGNEALNFGVVQMNKLLKDGIYFGGIFHTAVQVYGNVEWAYGSYLRDAWPGSKYNMVSRNSKHFCDEFLEKLGVPKLPNWANRFADIGDFAKETAGTVVKAKDKALNIVFHPVDFAFNFTAANKTSKAIYSPSEFGFSLNFAVRNFKVAAPVRSDQAN
ncbi:hypothetical protein T459_05987 [Capsicum annuum]|uniref:PPPDE domain-containing protein n=1 Tax=Capsicum annuum TaxID=4072 RepID=A0A2G3A9I1_CAPAN|nr:hypothetical protein T459_05987 [Capsicum annuum]